MRESGRPWGPLLPKEHGAYGQIAFPPTAAFLVAGASLAGALLAAAVVCGFLAHEPAQVLLGHRGSRARRELGRRAAAWLGVWAALGAAAGLAALALMPAGTRWSVASPVAPALLLAIALARGTEKSWYGEVAAALAFSCAAVPIAMAGGATARAALAVAIPFALLFVASTLAVRVIILQVRGGGNPAAVAATRRAALVLACISPCVLGLLAAAGLVPSSTLAAAAPGLVTAAAIAACPPPPARLKTVGWTILGVSVLTTAIVVTAG